MQIRVLWLLMIKSKKVLVQVIIVCSCPSPLKKIQWVHLVFKVHSSLVPLLLASLEIDEV